MTIHWHFEKSSPQTVVTGESDESAGSHMRDAIHSRNSNLVSFEGLLSYDEQTGLFTWLSGRRRGRAAGTLSDHGYIRINVLGRPRAAHRLAWLYVHGEWPPGNIDHIDGNQTNNAIANLRIATVLQNSMNRRAIRGYYFCRKRNVYQAKIKLHGRAKNLGCFKSEEEAKAAYRAASAQYFGEFSPYYVKAPA